MHRDGGACWRRPRALPALALRAALAQGPHRRDVQRDQSRAQRAVWQRNPLCRRGLVPLPAGGGLARRRRVHRRLERRHRASGGRARPWMSPGGCGNFALLRRDKSRAQTGRPAPRRKDARRQRAATAQRGAAALSARHDRRRHPALARAARALARARATGQQVPRRGALRHPHPRSPPGRLGPRAKTSRPRRRRRALPAPPLGRKRAGARAVTYEHWTYQPASAGRL